MIIYLTSYQNQEIIKNSVDKMKDPIITGEVGTEKKLDEFFREIIPKMNALDILIIDFLGISESGIYDSIKSFSNTYPDVQIIIIDEKRQPGDPLLYRLYELGIYDIIDNLSVDTLFRCMTVGMDERDSEKYHQKEEKKSFFSFKKKKSKVADSDKSQDAALRPTGEERSGAAKLQIEAEQPVEEIEQPQKKISDTEKLKSKLDKIRKPYTIGLAGTMNRIGTSHTMICIASCLNMLGYKVAVQESKKEIFQYIRNGYTDILENENGFTYNGIVFLESTEAALEKYDFVLKDYATDIEQEAFKNSNTKFLVSGSKAWEFEKFNKVLIEGQLDLNDYVHVFSFTSQSTGTEMRQALKEISPDIKMIFPGYIPDMFKPTEKQMTELLKYIA